MTGAALLWRVLTEAGDRQLPFLPDLTLYLATHSQQGTMPAAWAGHDAAALAHELGMRAWVPVRAWEASTPGVEVTEARTPTERTTRIVTPAGTLTSRWTAGSDGTWWQVEYPVKTAEDFAAALAWAEARSFRLLPEALAAARAGLRPDDVLAVELPTRPYADLLYDLAGMGEGYLLLLENAPSMGALLEVLEAKLQAFVAELAKLPVTVCFSPDNLDAQFITPPTFTEHFAPSYARTAARLLEAGKCLLVHAGGPAGRLLEALAACGVAGVEGVAPAPQGDTTLSQARQLAGTELVLWGGIAQDFVLATRTEADFQAAVAAAARDAAAAGRAVLGVADRVPAEVCLDRLRAIPGLAAAATQG